MKHNSAYNISCEIELKNGNSLILREIQQSQTYNGLLEGAPDIHFNRERNHEFQLRARKAFSYVDNFVHFPPVVRDYFREPGDMEGAMGLGRKIEWLPLVQCIGSFSSSYMRKNDLVFVDLVCTWYQDDYSMEIDGTVKAFLDGRSFDYFKYYTADEF